MEMVLACRSPAGPAASMSSLYVLEVHESLRVPCRDHHWAKPLPESGRVRSMTCKPAMRPERQVVASTRPQPVTRRCCSIGSSRTNAGWVTPVIAVRVAVCGSWTMTAPDSGSTHCRSLAASPGSARVPAGRGLTIRRRKRSCPPAERHAHEVATGSHWMALRPPTPTKASAAQSSRIGTT